MLNYINSIQRNQISSDALTLLIYASSRSEELLVPMSTIAWAHVRAKRHEMRWISIRIAQCPPCPHVKIWSDWHRICNSNNQSHHQQPPQRYYKFHVNISTFICKLVAIDVQHKLYIIYLHVSRYNTQWWDKRNT